MKKIICPTDFSGAANNAVEYAARLAQKINAELEIIHVQPLPAVPVEAGVPEAGEYLLPSETLQTLRDDIYKTFHVSCKYRIETTGKTLQKEIMDLSEENDLVVMGTNGVDGLYQYFFGTHTYQVIKKVKCPVLIIPEEVTYTAIKKAVFAWDYNRYDKKAFFRLRDFLNTDSAEITFLHISRKITAIGNDVFRVLKDEIHSGLNYHENVKFDRIFCGDPEIFPEKMTKYMNDVKADLLVITFYDRGSLMNLFHGAVARKLSETVNYPLLVLHAQA